MAGSVLSALRARLPAAVVVVVPYWSFFEYSVESDLRADRLRRAGSVVANLSSAGFDVGDPLVVEGVESGRTLAARVKDAAAVVVVQTMAVPPAFTAAFLEGLPHVPVIVAAVQGETTISDDFRHSDITYEGATVGTSMLTSTLVRRGRVFDLVVGRGEDSKFRSELEASVSAAVLASRLRAARIGVVGREIDGYECVTLDAAALRSQLGMTTVAIDPTEFETLFKQVPGLEVEAEQKRLRSCFVVDGNVKDEEMERSARATVALRVLAGRHSLDGGAFNCHVPQVRHSAAVGIAPCLALGESTAAGVPWTCSGDVATAVAMTAVKLLGLPALYHELEAMDAESGELVIANTGEHDAGFTDGPVEVRPNPWFSETSPRSLCAVMSPAAGPASLVAFTQVHSAGGSPQFRFVVATGRFTGRAFPGTGTPNAGFTYASSPAPEAWSRWCLTGANHHSAATPSHVAQVLERTSLHLGCGFVAV